MKSLENLNRECLMILEGHDLLEPLVRKELINDLVKTIDLDAEIVNTLKKKFLAEQKINDQNVYQDWLKKNSISEQQLIDEITFPVKLKDYCKEKFSHMTQTQYLKRKHDLDQAIYSLIRVQGVHEADELFQRIYEKEDNFGDLAKKFSLGPEKNSRGIVGPVFISKSHPILADKLRSSKPNQLHQPFSINNFWLIVRIESLSEVTLDEKIETAMEKELFEESLSEKIPIMIKDLKSKLNIDY